MKATRRSPQQNGGYQTGISDPFCAGQTLATLRKAFLIFWISLLPLSSAWGILTDPQDVAFTANADGSTQYYVIRLPENFNPFFGYDLLIALHGHGFDRWQFATGDWDETRAARDFAGKNNLIFVSPDYRPTTSWMGPLAEADVLQIIQDTKLQYPINRVFITGASMGGASALTFTALHPELINGVSAMNGTANHLEFEGFQDAITASFGGTKQQIPLEYKNRSAEYWPERFTMAVGLSAGGLDTTVPPQSFIRFAEILNKIQQKIFFLYQPRGGHFTSYSDALAILKYMYNPISGAYTLFLPLMLAD